MVWRHKPASSNITEMQQVVVFYFKIAINNCFIDMAKTLFIYVCKNIILIMILLENYILFNFFCPGRQRVVLSTTIQHNVSKLDRK